MHEWNNLSKSINKRKESLFLAGGLLYLIYEF